MTYFYKVYGLNIESEILVPELSELDKSERNNIDVSISYGEMPADIKELISLGRVANYQSQRMWFHIKDVASYCIENGSKITIELCEITDPQIVKVYILGSVLGMILLQRNIVAIHGGAIVIDGKGCIFTGDKGAGKSTLTTALRQKGYDFVSDDVGAIQTGDTNMIHPGFGYQKLCEDAMVKLGYNPGDFVPFRSDMNMKYIVPALDSFVDREVPFEALFELEVGDVNEVEIVEVKGNEKLQKLMKNIFRVEIIPYMGGMSPVYLKKCIEIAKGIKCYKIVRPKDMFTVDEQIRLIECMIRKYGYQNKLA